MRGAGDTIDDNLDHTGYFRQRLVAAIALLQPGIDPVFLMLLSNHNGLALADHGLIVAGGMAGMAAGALLFAAVPRMSTALLRLAALGALVASLVTIVTSGLAALIAIRAGFGLCNGVLYAGALSAATRRDPGHAMGTVLLGQLLLSTLVALALPLVAMHAGPGVALALLAGFAALCVGLVSAEPAGKPQNGRALLPASVRGDGTAAGVAVLLFVGGNMMVWSYVGAQGAVAGLSETIVGLGVALGSLAGGVAAWAVAQESRSGWPRVPVLPAAVLCALAILSPFLTPGGGIGFAAVMVLFNIGATWSVGQFSAHAIARSGDLRRLVPALHSGGMVAGPLAAAAAMHAGGFAALAGVVAVVLGLGVAALVIDVQRPRAVLPADVAAQQDFLQEGLTQS